MREIHKTVSFPVDGETKTFRITKLDAFSGACLVRMIRKYLPAEAAEAPSAADALFAALPEGELRSLMRACLRHAELRLEAGFHPVMEQDEWGVPELEHNTAACLRLTLEVVLWTLADFFTGGGPGDRSAGEQG